MAGADMGSAPDAPSLVRVRVRVRTPGMHTRMRAGIRFEPAWREVEVTEEQLAQLKADVHLIVAELRVGEKIARALSVEEAKRRTGDPWELLDGALARIAAFEARLAGPAPEAAPAPAPAAGAAESDALALELMGENDKLAAEVEQLQADNRALCAKVEELQAQLAASTPPAPAPAPDAPKAPPAEVTPAAVPEPAPKADKGAPKAKG